MNDTLVTRACALALELRETLHALARDPEVLAMVSRHFKVVKDGPGNTVPDGPLIGEGRALPLRIWDLECELDKLMRGG